MLSSYCGKYAVFRCFYKMERRGRGNGPAIRLAAITVLALLFGQCHPLPDIIKIGKSGLSSCHFLLGFIFRCKFHARCNPNFLGGGNFPHISLRRLCKFAMGKQKQGKVWRGTAERGERCGAHEAAGALSDSRHRCLRNGSSSRQ